MKKVISFILCALLLFSLTACAASAPATPTADVQKNAAAIDAVSPSAAPEKESGGEANSADGLGALPNSALPETDRKLTYSASFSINTKTYNADYAKINELLSAANGYVAAEQTSGTSSASGKNNGRSSVLSLRVPSENLNTFIDGVSGIGTIISKNKTTDDISSQYYDTDARIEMLTMRKDRLMGYLANATAADDIIAFEKELSDVLYQLDQLQGSKRQMDDLVDYAKVDVTLTELLTPETIGADGQPLGDRASEAFSVSMTGVSDFMDGFAVFFASAAPVLLFLAILAVIIFGVIKLVLFLRKKYYIAHPKKAHTMAQPPYQAPPNNTNPPNDLQQPPVNPKK